MSISIRACALVGAGLPFLLTAACVDTGAGDDIEMVSGAITNAQQTLDENNVTTAYDAQVAVGGATDHVLPVWIGKDAAGSPQVVGQSFAAKDGAPFGDPPRRLHAYSTGADAKSFPAVAFDDSGNNKMLVVWQDDYSATDSDIWGAIVDDQGKLMTRPANAPNPFHVNYDTDNEKTPTVTWVRDLGQYLVTYTRKIASPARTALTAQWVDVNGAAGSLFDVVASGVNQGASRPTTAHARGSDAVLFTWNDNQFAFGDTQNPVGLVGNTVTGTQVQGLVAAATSTPSGGTTALAWRNGDGSSCSIKGRVFANGCFGPACAGAVQTLLSAGSGGVTNLHTPVIAPAGTGFAVYAGSEESTWHIKYAAFGGPSGTLASVTPDCAGPLQSVGGHSLGSPGGVIAATGLPNALGQTDVRSFLVYDSFCGTPSTYAKEWVSGVNPATTSDVLSFNVSNN